MNAKQYLSQQYLSQAYRLDELIDSDLKELEQLKSLATCVSSPNLSEMPHSPNRSTEPSFVRCLPKINDLEDEINNELDKYLDLKLEIRTSINALTNNDEKALLKYRYINFYDWETICEKMNVSLRTAYRIHSTALRNIKIPNIGTLCH